MVLHLHTYGRSSLCVITQKHVFWFYISKNTKKFNNSKNFKKRVGIRYQCHRMLPLVVGACQDLPENLSRIGIIIDGNYLPPPPWKEISWIGMDTLPPPSLCIASAQRHWARSRTLCRGTSTLGLNPRTRLKKNVLSMLLKPKFHTLPILQSLSYCFMLLNNVVLQS